MWPRAELIFFNGDARKELLAGKTEIPLAAWNHVLLIRDGMRVTAYLNFAKDPELAGELSPGFEPGTGRLFFGGRSDNFADFEGKLDEAAIYDRVLKADEIARHHVAAGFHP